MAKKKKGKTQNKSVNKPKAVVADEVKVSAPEAEVKAEAVAEVNQPEVKPEVKETKCEKAGKKSKVVEVKAKDVKKESKPKKPNKLAKNLKDTGAELKKVTWPKFKDVVKQTGIVLVVVLVFALVLFGLDRLCYWLTSFLY